MVVIPMGASGDLRDLGTGTAGDPSAWNRSEVGAGDRHPSRGAQLAEVPPPRSENWRKRGKSEQVSAGREYILAAMKSLRFLPLTFLAGVHGFALFAPYAALATAAVLVLRRRRQPVPVPVAAVVPRRV
jgi:hypothetical protein